MKLQKLAAKLAYRGFYKLAQQLDEAFVQGPSVQVDPALGAQVQDAVNELKKADPNIFKGIGKITVLTGGPFGMVTSKDPSTVQINLNKIKQEVQKQMGGTYNPSNPEHKKAFDEAVKRSIVETVSHEAAHTKDFNPETGKFPGGEGVAESAERSMMQKMYQGKPIEMSAISKSNLYVFKHATRGVSQDYSKKKITSTEYLTSLKLGSKYIKANQEALEEYESYLEKMEKLMDEYNKPMNLISLENINDLFSEVRFHKQWVQDKLESTLLNYREAEDLLKFFNSIIEDPKKLEEAYANKSKLSEPQLKALYQALLHGQSAAVVPHLLLDPDLIWRQLGEDISKKVKIEKNSQVKLRNKKAQTGIEPSGSQLAGHDEYNITGNDYLAGGPNAEPKETRLQALYRKHKDKLTNKKAGLYYYKENG